MAIAAACLPQAPNDLHSRIVEQRVPMPANAEGRSRGICSYLEQMPYKEFTALCEQGYLLELLNDLETTHVKISTYVHLLRMCGEAEALPESKCIHVHMIKRGLLDRHRSLGNRLLQSYLQCGSVEDARSLFDKMPQRDVMAWTLMIAAYAQNGHCREALHLFRKVLLEGEALDCTTFVTVLNACSSPALLAKGELIHACIVEAGLEGSNVFVSTALVNMYGRCGCLSEARRMFDKMSERNVVSWNAMIALYAQNSYCHDALQLFRQMQVEGVMPNKVTFVSMPNACTSLAEGICIHVCIVEIGYETNAVVGNALLNMYGKLGFLQEAHRLFHIIDIRNAISWNAMIAAYAQEGHLQEALHFFRQMQLDGTPPSRTTFLSVLNACNNGSADVASVRLVHARAAEAGLDSDVVVGTALVNMYGICGSLKDAERVFKRICQADVVLWSAMVAAYAENGQFEQMMKLFRQMQVEGVKPNHVTFVTVVNACASESKLAEGKMIHRQIDDSQLQSSISLGTCLADMYGKCAMVQDAQRVFDQMQTHNLVSWNTIIAAYALNGHIKEALLLFHQMQVAGIRADNVTFATIMNACVDAEQDDTSSIQLSVLEWGYDSDVLVGTALVNMHGKQGNLRQMQRSFNRILEPNVFTWNAMIAAYAQNGQEKQALICYRRMQLQGVSPDTITFVEVIGSITATAEGRKIHEHVAQSGLESKLVVGTALVNMYGGCGACEDARRVFDKMMQDRDVVTWNSMLGAYAQHGHASEALNLFHEMQQVGIDPANATFVSVLSACGHAGLTEKGSEYFASMLQDHCLLPTIEHYGCVVDMLGRVGLLKDAERFITGLPLQPDAVLWMALLSACRTHANIEVGRHATEQVLELSLYKSAAYVVMSNIYSTESAQPPYLPSTLQRRDVRPLKEA